MQVFDLEPFAKYIKDHGLAKEHNIPYYVKWVQKFLTSDLPDIVTSTGDRIQAFENLLSKDPSLKDWQLWQALKAVELYVKVFVKGTPFFCSVYRPRSFRMAWVRERVQWATLRAWRASTRRRILSSVPE